MYQLHKFKFPDNFIFGVADADLQVIGEKNTIKHEKSELTAWTVFGEKSGKVFDNHTPMEGVDRYHRWSEDLNLIQQLSVKHYRTSASICRTMTRDMKPNHKALDWYKEYFSAMRERGIKIYLTLYHWELPQYLSEKGGWKNREIVNYLVKHAEIVHEHLNEFVEEYFILNEPFQSTFESYHNGVHAPGESTLAGGLASVHHILLAQGLMFQALKARDPKVKLSTVYNPSMTYAVSQKEKDITAAQWAFAYQTLMFTDPTYRGVYPEFVMERLESSMPKIEANDMKTIQIGSGLEHFGVNYYRGKIAKYKESADFLFEEIRWAQGMVNGLGWPVFLAPTYPEGLYDLLKELHSRYSAFGMKGIYITENGTCCENRTTKKGNLDDEFRIFFVREHLKLVQKAILARVPVKGYFMWTLLDNYEWDLGYCPESCFGIVHVDRDNMQRTPKKSYHWFKDLVETHVLK